MSWGPGKGATVIYSPEVTAAKAAALKEAAKAALVKAAAAVGTLIPTSEQVYSALGEPAHTGTAPVVTPQAIAATSTPPTSNGSDGNLIALIIAGFLAAWFFLKK